MFIMAKLYALLSVENCHVKCFICNREFKKNEKVKKFSSKEWETFIAMSKSCINLNLYVQKYGKVHINYQSLFFIKQNTFAKR